MPTIAISTRFVNNTGGIYNLIPGPVIYVDPAAVNDYNAATISSLVFGIFMALLTLYMIWQNGVQCSGA
jgi:hypothetical protein